MLMDSDNVKGYDLDSIRDMIMSDIEAYKSTDEGKNSQKRLSKFIDKQMRKPRPRYLKKLRYGEQDDF
jgi:hypothetical protein